MKTYNKITAEKIKEILKRSSDSHNVFTPFELCDEMLDKIPELNINQSILVMFNLEFVHVIRERFGKEGLSNLWFLTPDEFKKKAAIIMGVNENHILTYSYKDKKVEEYMPKFDVVVGNPPYQAEKTNIKAAGSGNAIWQYFVEIAFKILKENGYLCFIHPVDWRTSEKAPRKKQKAQELLFDNQIVYLKTQTAPFPGIGAMVDWYVAQKTPVNKETEIDFLDGKAKQLINKPPVFAYGGNIVESIKTKVLKTNNNGLIKSNSFWYDPDKGINKKYKYAHGTNYLKNEWKYYDTPHKDQFTPKVIMSAVRKLRPIYDDGEIGIAGHVHYIPVNNKKEGDFLISIINSKLGIFLQKIFCTTFWSGDSSHWNNPYPISKLKIDDEQLKDDKDVYRYFNLTKEEINYIESQIK